MYELFQSNEQDESILLIEDGMESLKEAMQALKECEEPHCQIEKFDVPDDVKGRLKAKKKQNYWEYVRLMGIYGRYTLIATKHYGEITKFY